MLKFLSSRRAYLASGRVYVRELLGLVGAAAEDPPPVEDAVRHVYDWHIDRSVAGLQLTFAPAVAAILAILARPDSAVIIVGGCVTAVAVLLEIFQLLSLNGLHGEDVYAVRLAAELVPFRTELKSYPHGDGAPDGSIAKTRYEEIGRVSMMDYRAHPGRRECVLAVLSECRRRNG